MTTYQCNGFPSTILPDSKILIIGTLPPYGRKWYYEKDPTIWKILEAATSDISGISKEEKEQFLKRNKIAFWDVFAFAERENSKTTDKFKGEKANLIWQNIQDIEVIIINGKTKAFSWFKKYNGDCTEVANQDYYLWKNKIKIYPLHATSYIKRYNKKASKNLWIEAIRKNLDSE